MVKVAAEVGLSDSDVLDISEDNYKMRSFTERLFGRRNARLEDKGSVLGKANSLRIESLDEEVSVNLVKDTIIGAYRHDNLVIIGRGGQALLREMPGVLHVRMTAPLGARALNVKEREGIPLIEANELTKRKDASANAYLSRFFGIDWDNPLLYHMMLNTGRWELDDVVDIILNALGNLRTLSH